jgi:hypothetical protein
MLVRNQLPRVERRARTVTTHAPVKRRAKRPSPPVRAAVAAPRA